MTGQLTRAMDLLWASFRRGWGNKIPTTKTYKGRVTRAIKGIPESLLYKENNCGVRLNLLWLVIVLWYFWYSGSESEKNIDN